MTREPADYLDDVCAADQAADIESTPVMAVLTPARSSIELEIWSRYVEHQQAQNWPMVFLDTSGAVERLTRAEADSLAALGLSENEWRSLVSTPQGLLALNRIRHERAMDSIVDAVERGRYPREILDLPLFGGVETEIGE